uniref:Uncharacterized protein n=1 Tax=Gopherus evgoodei TaxID=1825980 RepID=A0A8C4WEL7_9SAUR
FIWITHTSKVCSSTAPLPSPSPSCWGPLSSNTPLTRVRMHSVSASTTGNCGNTSSTNMRHKKSEVRAAGDTKYSNSSLNIVVMFLKNATLSKTMLSKSSFPIRINVNEGVRFQGIFSPPDKRLSLSIYIYTHTHIHGISFKQTI